MACPATTVFVDLLGRSGKALKTRAQAAISGAADPQRPHSTTRFNFAELLSGVEGADDPVIERQRVDAVLEGVVILEFDDQSTLQFAKVDHYLRRIGRPKGD